MSGLEEFHCTVRHTVITCRTVEMLQKALSQQRELTVYHAREMEKEGERRLELQKQEYESTIQRHQSFIDQVCVCDSTLHIVCVDHCHG